MQGRLNPTRQNRTSAPTWKMCKVSFPKYTGRRLLMISMSNFLGIELRRFGSHDLPRLHPNWSCTNLVYDIKREIQINKWHQIINRYAVTIHRDKKHLIESFAARHVCLAQIARLPNGTSGLRGTAVASDRGGQKPWSCILSELRIPEGDHCVWLHE